MHIFVAKKIFWVAIFCVTLIPYTTSATYTQQQTLQPSELSTSDKMGEEEDTIAIDGTFMAVGVRQYNSDQGVVFLYRDNNGDGKWDTGAGDVLIIEASDGASGDFFGHSVDIDGNYLIVGAYLDDDTEDGSGSAYVYEYGGSGWTTGSWAEDKLTADDPGNHDHFGASVGIVDDSGTAYAIVGASLDNEVDTNAGAVYIYKEVSNGVWDDGSDNAEQKIVAADGASGDKLGLSVDIGIGFAVGGAEEKNNKAGAGYVIVKNGDTWGVDGKTNAKLTMDNQGGTDHLGSDA